MFNKLSVDTSYEPFYRNLTKHKSIKVLAKIDGENWYDISKFVKKVTVNNQIQLLDTPTIDTAKLIVKNDNNAFTSTVYNDEFNPNVGKINGTLEQGYLNRIWEVQVYTVIYDVDSRDCLDMPDGAITYFRYSLVDIVNGITPEGYELTPDTLLDVAIPLFRGWKPSQAIVEKHKEAEIELKDMLWITTQKRLKNPLLYTSMTPNAIISDLLTRCGLDNSYQNLQQLNTTFDVFIAEQDKSYWQVIQQICEATAGIISTSPEGKIIYRTRIESFTEPAIALTIIQENFSKYNLEQKQKYNQLKVESEGYEISASNEDLLVDTTLTGDAAIIKAGQTQNFEFEYTSEYGKDFANTVFITVKLGDTIVDNLGAFSQGDDDGFIRLNKLTAYPDKLVLNITNLASTVDYTIAQVRFRGRQIKKLSLNSVEELNVTDEPDNEIFIKSFYSDTSILSNVLDALKFNINKDIVFKLTLNEFYPDIFAGNLVNFNIPLKGIASGTFIIEQIKHIINDDLSYNTELVISEWKDVIFDINNKEIYKSTPVEVITESSNQSMIEEIIGSISELQEDMQEQQDITSYLDGVAPNTPTGLLVTTEVINQESVLKVSFNPNTELDLLGYEIAYSQDGVWWQYNVVSETSVYIQVIGNTQYYVKVRAFDAEGYKSAWTDTVSIVSAKDTIAPSVPTGLTVEPLFQKIVVKWNMNTEPDLAKYSVQVSLDNFVTVKDTIYTVSNYIVYGGKTNTLYYFRVSAIDTSENMSEYSNVVSATTAAVYDEDLESAIIEEMENNLETLNNETLPALQEDLSMLENIAALEIPASFTMLFTTSLQDDLGGVTPEGYEPVIRNGDFVNTNLNRELEMQLGLINENITEINNLITQTEDIETNIENINGTITNIQTTVDTHTSQISQTISDVTALVNRVTANEEDITTIEQTVGQIQTTVDTHTSQISQTISDVTALVNRVTANEEDITTIEQTVGQIQTTVDTHTSQISQTISDVTALANRVTANEEDITTIEQTVGQIQTTVDTHTSQISQTISDVTALVNRVTANEEDITTIEQTAGQIQTTVDTHTSQISQTISDVTALAGRVTSVEGDITTIEQTAGQIQTTVTSHETRISDAETTLVSYGTQITQNANSISSIATRVTDTETNITAIIQDVDSIESTVVSHSDTLETHATSIQQNANSITSIVSDINDINTNISSITQTVSQIQTTVSSHTTELGTLSTQVTQNTNSITAVVLRVDTAEANISQIQQDIDSIELSVTSITGDISDINSNITTLDSRITIAEGNITSTVSRVTSLETNVTTIIQDVDSIESIVATHTTKLNEHDNTLTTHYSQIQQNTDSITSTVANVEMLENISALEIPASFSMLFTTSLQDDIGGVTPEGYEPVIRNGDFINTNLNRMIEVHETRITQTENDITLMALDIDGLETNFSQLQVTVNGINATVISQGETLDTHASQIQQNANSITSIVADIDGINTNISSITQTVSQIQTTVSSHTTELGTLSTQVTQNTNSISSLATRVTDTETTITAIIQDVDSIESTVISQGETLDTHASQIQQNANSITSIVADIDGINTNISSITQTVSQIQTTVSSHTTELGTLSTQVTQNTNSITAVVSRVDTAEANISQIQQDIDSIELSVTNITGDISDINSNITTLDSRITIAEGNITSTVSRVTSLETNVTTIIQDVDSIESIVATHTTKLNEHDNTLTTHYSQIQQNTDSITSTVANVEMLENISALEIPASFSMLFTTSLQDDIGGVTPEGYEPVIRNGDFINTNLNRMIEVHETRITQTENDIKLTALDIDGLETNFSQLQVTVNGINATVISQGETLSIHASQIQQNANSITSIVADIDGINTNISSITQTVSQIQTTVSSHTTELGTLSTQVTQNTNSISSLATRVTDTETTITAIIQDVDSIESTVISQGETLDTHASQIQQNANSITSIVADIDGINTNISSITQTVDEIQLTVSSHTTELGTLSTQVTQNTNSISSIATRVTDTETTITAIIQDVDSIESTVISQGETLDTHASQIQQNANSITSIVADIDGINTNISSITQTVDEIQLTVSSHTTELGTLSTQVTQNTNSISSLATRVTDTETTITAIIQDVDSIESTVISQGETLDTHASQIQQLSNQITFAVAAVDENGNPVTGASLVLTADGKIKATADKFIVDGDVLVNGSITASKLGADSVTANAIGANQIITNVANIKNGVIETAHIKDAAIETAKIANAAITNAKIGTAAVDTANIADLAVTNAKINDINAEKITAGYIDSDRIKAGSITADKIAAEFILQSNQIIQAGTADRNYKLDGSQGLIRGIYGTNYNIPVIIKHGIVNFGGTDFEIDVDISEFHLTNYYVILNELQGMRDFNESEDKRTILSWRPLDSENNRFSITYTVFHPGTWTYASNNEATTITIPASGWSNWYQLDQRYYCSGLRVDLKYIRGGNYDFRYATHYFDTDVAIDAYVRCRRTIQSIEVEVRWHAASPSQDVTTLSTIYASDPSIYDSIEAKAAYYSTNTFEPASGEIEYILIGY